MNLHAWAEQRAMYSRANHGRNERGAALVECALIAATAGVKGVRNSRFAAPAPAPATQPAARPQAA